jgi:predicted transcriptional regulator
MDKSGNDSIDKKLDTILDLLRHILALQLATRGVRHAEIGKHLHVAKATVGKMLKGVRDES